MGMKKSNKFLFIFTSLILSLFMIGNVSASFSYYPYDSHYNSPVVYNLNYEKNNYHTYPTIKTYYQNKNTYYNYGSRDYTRKNLHRHQGKNFYKQKDYLDYRSLHKYQGKNFYKQKDYLDYRTKGSYKYYEGFFGNEINEYNIHLKNEKNKGSYFTVKFYLSDAHGNKRVETSTKYLRPYERKLFTYKNVFNDDYDYSWGYEVVSHTIKSQEKNTIKIKFKFITK